MSLSLNNEIHNERRQHADWSDSHLESTRS